MEKSSELLKLMIYLKRNVEYYKNIIPDSIDNNNFPIDEIYGIFAELPIIEKSDIKLNYYCFISDKLRPYDLSDLVCTEKDFKREYTYQFDDLFLVVEYTSGSNGSPFLSIKSHDERLLLGNYMWRVRSKFHSVKPNELFNFIHNFGDKRYPFPFEYIEDETERAIKELCFLSQSQYKWWHINFYSHIVAVLSNSTFNCSRRPLPYHVCVVHLF